jgi:O-antigen/teichoic acid export membrane protein
VSNRPSTTALASKDGFMRSAAVLMSGTIGAHALSAALLPVLSRLYSPEEFGLLAVLTAVVSTVAVAAAFRFDVAIALPEDSADASGLLVLGVICATGVAILMAVVVLLAPDILVRVIGQPGLASYLWMIPLCTFSVAVVSALQNWYVRGRHFKQLSAVRFVQSGSAGGVQVGGHAAGFGAVGLLLGYLATSATAVMLLAPRAILAVRENRRVLEFERLRALAHTYRRFPQYSTWEALANVGATQIPIVLVAAFAASSEAGFIVWAMYVLQAPLSILGSAVAQVFLSEAAEHDRRGDLRVFTLKVISGMIKAGLGPLLAIGIVAPATFGLIFGDGWQRAGALVSWMVPWFILQFIVSPVSMALHVRNRQRTALVLQVLGFAVRAGVVWLAAQAFTGYIGEAYALSGAVVYGLYLVVVCREVAIRRDDLLDALRASVVHVVAWTAAAIVVAVGARIVSGA